MSCAALVSWNVQHGSTRFPGWLGQMLRSRVDKIILLQHHDVNQAHPVRWRDKENLIVFAFSISLKQRMCTASSPSSGSTFASWTGLVVDQAHESFICYNILRSECRSCESLLDAGFFSSLMFASPDTGTARFAPSAQHLIVGRLCNYCRMCMAYMLYRIKDVSGIAANLCISDLWIQKSFNDSSMVLRSVDQSSGMSLRTWRGLLTTALTESDAEKMLDKQNAMNLFSMTLYCQSLAF